MSATAEHHIHHAAAEDLCDGCSQPAYYAGPLAPCLVTFTTGEVSSARYCPECMTIAELSAQDPGGSYGAIGLSGEIARVERNGGAAA